MIATGKLDCHQADKQLLRSDRALQLPIPTTGNLDADFNATQMVLAQRELVAAHVEISCGANPRAIQAAKDLEQQAQERLLLYHNLPQSRRSETPTCRRKGESIPPATRKVCVATARITR
jgi:hypothetical protein